MKGLWGSLRYTRMMGFGLVLFGRWADWPFLGAVDDDDSFDRYRDEAGLAGGMCAYT